MSALSPWTPIDGLLFLVEADDPGSATGLGESDLLHPSFWRIEIEVEVERCMKGKKEFFCGVKLYRRSFA